MHRWARSLARTIPTSVASTSHSLACSFLDAVKQETQISEELEVIFVPKGDRKFDKEVFEEHVYDDVDKSLLRRGVVVEASVPLR